MKTSRWWDDTPLDQVCLVGVHQEDRLTESTVESVFGRSWWSIHLFLWRAPLVGGRTVFLTSEPREGHLGSL